MKMPIPNDWDGLTFCNFLVKWPQSTLWRIILRGLLSNPSLVEFWDATTGDVEQTIEDFRPALDINLDELECTNMNIPVGTIWIFAGEDAPEGWLFCNGQRLSWDTYPDLFAVIGLTYGGVGVDHLFDLPNLKGRVPVGFDSSQSEFDVLGETGGAKTHTLTIAQMPSHRHTVSQVVNGAGSVQLLTQAGVAAISNQTNLTGSGEAHNNLQPYLTLNYIIRAVP